MVPRRALNNVVWAGLMVGRKEGASQNAPCCLNAEQRGGFSNLSKTHFQASRSPSSKMVSGACLLFFCVQSGVSLGGRSGSYMVVSLCPSTYSRSAGTGLAAASHKWLPNETFKLIKV